MSCLRFVEDSDGRRLSLRGVQGVAAGVANSELVITQEEAAGVGFRLQEMQEEKLPEIKKTARGAVVSPMAFKSPSSIYHSPHKINGPCR